MVLGESIVMSSPKDRNPGARFLLAAASVVVVVAGLRAAAQVLLPLLVAVFLSILSAPLLGALMRRRVPKWLAVILTVLANFAVLAAIVWLVSGSVNAFVRSWPRYQDAVEHKAVDVAAELAERLTALGIETPDFAWLNAEDELPPAGEPPAAGPPATEPGVDRPQLSIAPSVDLLSSALRGVVTTLRGVANVLSYTVVVLLSMIFILLEAPTLPAKLQRAFNWHDEELQRLLKIRREIQHYLGIKTAVSLATGVIITLWLTLLGVDYALLWGLIAFLLNYIPTLGSILASIPAVLLAWVDVGVGEALLVVVGYAVVNVVIGNLIEPQLMGRRFGLSTLVVFLSLVFWFWLWGPLGALLSVPLTMMIKIMLENTSDLRWVAQLLGPSPAPQPRPRAEPPAVRPPDGEAAGN
ncbi:MAG: AI-2E family transporter [Acidobacteria bacterium]|nr:MAG: AI-2E family transporter [Acidobacteriota bacterium]